MINMVEKGEFSDYKISTRDYIGIDQNSYLRDSDDNIIMLYRIFPVGASTFFSFFERGEESDLASKGYPMYVNMTGAPPDDLITDIPGELRFSDIRFELQIEAESSFYTLREESYLRYIHDFSLDDWNSININRLVEELKKRGIPVSIAMERERSLGIYQAILLFEKEPDSKNV